MDFAELVHREREKKYKSSKEFVNSSQLPCTYFYYTKVEKGEALPGIEVAVAILKALDISLRHGLFAWVRSQMPDAETRAYFTEIDNSYTLSGEQVSTRRSLVVNRMQLKLLREDPALWELVILVHCYFKHRSFTAEELSRETGLSFDKTRQLIQELHDFGILDWQEDGSVVSKEWVYIPYEKEFEELRDRNLRRAMERFLDQGEGRKFRTTITRLLTEPQQREVEAKVVALTNAIIDMPELSPPQARPYTLGVFGSLRRFGNAQ